MMGSRKMFAQMVQDTYLRSRGGLSHMDEVTSAKDYMQLMSATDEMPASMGGRENRWRNLVADGKRLFLQRQSISKMWLRLCGVVSLSFYSTCALAAVARPNGHAGGLQPVKPTGMFKIWQSVCVLRVCWRLTRAYRSVSCLLVSPLRSRWEALPSFGAFYREHCDGVPFRGCVAM